MIYINPYSFGGFSNLYSNDMDGVNEYASVPDNSAFSFAGAFSWIIWMKRDAIGVNSALFGKYTSTSSNNAEWYASIIGSTLRFLLTNTTGAVFIGRTAPMSTVGSWVGLAGVSSGGVLASTIKLYTITGGTVTAIDTLNLNAGVYAGMTNGTSPLYIGAINGGGITWTFNGNLFHPQIWNRALTAGVGGELAQIGANPRQDVRLFSFGADCVSAWHYPSGQAGYPAWTDYVNGRNATMQNAENTDINTDIP